MNFKRLNQVAIFTDHNHSFFMQDITFSTFYFKFSNRYLEDINKYNLTYKTNMHVGLNVYLLEYSMDFLRTHVYKDPQSPPVL